ncbi:undecaprenyl-phosphate glucose phosphotransferase [Mesorhizobium sp. CAU 1732]|uniref:undecaprenyl-phosphate glucose phosphotransferase n=1 Tax=Mesorhizobium sp. CAU 1732 TaxID=3140358 RepID=UPI0032607FE1
MSLKDTDFPEPRFQHAVPLGEYQPLGLRARPQAVSPQVAGQIYAAIELTVVLTLGVAIGYLYVYGQLEHHDFMNTYIWPSILTVVVFGYLNYRSDQYSLDRLSRFVTHSGGTIANLAGAFGVVALIGVVFGAAGEFSRVWFGVWLIAAAASVWTMRAIASGVFRSELIRGAICRQAAIFGMDQPLQRALKALASDDSGVKIMGVFSPESSVSDTDPIERDQGLAKLIAFGQSHSLDTIIIALPPSRRRYLQTMLAELSVLPAEIKLLPDIETQAVPMHGISSLARVQFIDIQQKPISGWGHMMKAVEDYSIAAIATILLAPLLLVVAAAIKLDSSGPVFFRQKRHGLNNKVISVLKFRTMHVQQENRFLQATRNDKRVTRVGRILRRLSIDELPQLFNVLRGEMSIVGPRPHAVEMNAAYCQLLPLYNNRHRVKPGITGWAQVNDYRGPTYTVEDMRKRLDADLYYIENWSILFDVSIIAATPFIGLIHKNAV